MRDNEYHHYFAMWNMLCEEAALFVKYSRITPNTVLYNAYLTDARDYLATANDMILY